MPAVVAASQASRWLLSRLRLFSWILLLLLKIFVFILVIYLWASALWSYSALCFDSYRTYSGSKDDINFMYFLLVKMKSMWKLTIYPLKYIYNEIILQNRVFPKHRDEEIKYEKRSQKDYQHLQPDFFTLIDIPNHPKEKEKRPWRHSKDIHEHP